MGRIITGYCWGCCRNTKQKVINCEDNLAYRVFETVFTLGFAAALPHDYNCECTRCGRINQIRR